VDRPILGVFFANAAWGVFIACVSGAVFSLFAPGLLRAAGWLASALDSGCACSGISAICIGRPCDFRPEVDLFPNRLGPEACDVAGVTNWTLSGTEDNFLLFRDPLSDPSSGPSYRSGRGRAEDSTEFWLTESTRVG
jgi:hypothetical protein